jgi:hypothetical protein
MAFWFYVISLNMRVFRLGYYSIFQALMMFVAQVLPVDSNDGEEWWLCIVMVYEMDCEIVL